MNNDLNLSTLADSYDANDAVETETVDTAVAATVSVPTVVVNPTVKGATPGRVGRPVDNSGKTGMGKARMIFAANPSFSSGELRDAIMAQVGCRKNVASTYASKLRSTKA